MKITSRSTRSLRNSSYERGFGVAKAAMERGVEDEPQENQPDLDDVKWSRAGNHDWSRRLAGPARPSTSSARTSPSTAAQCSGLREAAMAARATRRTAWTDAINPLHASALGLGPYAPFISASDTFKPLAFRICQIRSKV